jgi:hypothetical protein
MWIGLPSADIYIECSQYQDSNLGCFCPNTCPSEAERIAQDAIINGDADREAKQLVAAATMVKTVRVSKR